MIICLQGQLDAKPIAAVPGVYDALITLIAAPAGLRDRRAGRLAEMLTAGKRRAAALIAITAPA